MPPGMESRQALRLAAIADTLRRCALFSDLPAEDLDAVAEGSVLRTLERPYPYWPHLLAESASDW